MAIVAVSHQCSTSWVRSACSGASSCRSPSTQGSDFVTVLLGNHDGTFQAPRQFPVGSGQAAISAREPILADFTGDGNLDIAVPNYFSADVSILVGNGDGPTITIDQVAQVVANGLRDGKRKVVLQADGMVPHGEVLKLAAAVTEVEGVTLHVGVKEPEG